MRVKICGITQAEQGQAIAALGATALGFICVERSPRYINAQKIQPIIQTLPTTVDSIGVFANASLTDIEGVLKVAQLTAIQLHGEETPEFCTQVKQLFPHLEIIKAFRIKTSKSLVNICEYVEVIDTLLLDAYDPHQLGGTGKTLNWDLLRNFHPGRPWFLAGGLTPDNVLHALEGLSPDGIDLSSGVERSPGDKDILKVTQLLENLRKIN
ncbi:N-(5'-phosphoribosyl) anthranilate isomerase [Crocosphaera subtropica ATCC 51142]|uniref:N-(5'-phosphoribosyl)anthranilate isomerase n=1 Tax=Crocosphaera subtropica (strain ATCC 51142 / BH68) TaxID=43989 RepID=TRPF_CROS5|nr:phosphoribosylanthranilate isomerase [Crocosphaera subtropica]B1WT19.1 RecName: Full=N-(5'-phosphoribosyl)anthranilate isomerase; Short=PRAI [Crocosphaera subtropica ATCC 51142]ACB50349.1 N-(5'-phosphoribosyl) anthranilate isomerase [Crocosphaera subtropica ATCC 51142]